MFGKLLETVKELQHRAFDTDSLVGIQLESTEISKLITNQSIYLQKDGMKRVISKMQRGDNCLEFYNDVVKIIDTNEAILKRMVIYYFTFYWKLGMLSDNMILMCSNSLVNDLNGLDADLICVALDFLIAIHDVNSFSTFSKSIRKLLNSKKESIQIRILSLFAVFSDDDSDFIIKNEFVEGLVHIFRTSHLDVQACAARCINRSTFKFFRSAEILDYFTQIQNLPKSDTSFYSVTAAIGIIEENIDKFSVTEKKSLVDSLRSMLTYDYFTAICAAGLLLKIDHSYYQIVFDSISIQLHLSNEELFYILLFLEELITTYPSLKYSNGSFSIFCSDPAYIKHMKMELLKYRVDKYTISEIISLKSDDEFILKVLSFCLEYDIANKDVLRRSYTRFEAETVKMLEFYQPAAYEWKIIINDLLKEMRISSRLTYLVGNYYDKMLPENELKGFDGQSRMNILLNYFIRQMIGEDVLIASLKEISEEGSSLKFEIDIVMRMVIENDIYRLKKYIDPQLHCISHKRVFENVYEHSNISGLKPFEMYEPAVTESTNLSCIFSSTAFKDSLISEESDKHDESQTISGNLSTILTPDKDLIKDHLRDVSVSLNIKPLTVKENLPASYSTQMHSASLEDTQKILDKDLAVVKADLLLLKSISNICFTAKVFLSHRSVILSVATIARPFKIVAQNLEDNKEMLISDANDYTIGYLEMPKPFSLKINQLYGYYININSKICTSPYLCEQEIFDKAYEGINNSSTVNFESVKRLPLHSVDREKIAFKIMGVPFFGKIAKSGLILKCSDKALLSRFVEDTN